MRIDIASIVDVESTRQGQGSWLRIVLSLVVGRDPLKRRVFARQWRCHFDLLLNPHASPAALACAGGSRACYSRAATRGHFGVFALDKFSYSIFYSKTSCFQMNFSSLVFNDIMNNASRT